MICFIKDHMDEEGTVHPTTTDGDTHEQRTLRTNRDAVHAAQRELHSVLLLTTGKETMVRY